MNQKLNYMKTLIMINQRLQKERNKAKIDKSKPNFFKRVIGGIKEDADGLMGGIGD